jgi:hypothetical protein
VWVIRWFAGVRNDAAAPHQYLRERAVIALLCVGTAAALVTAVRRWPRIVAALILVVGSVEVGIHTPRWFASTDTSTAYAPVEVANVAAAADGRIVRVGGRSATPTFTFDVPMAYGLRDADGVASYFPTDYDRYRRVIDDYGAFAVNFNATPPLASADVLDSPLLDALNVTTVIAESNVPLPPSYSMLSAAEPRVYSRRASGAAVVVASALPATEDAMWRAVADPGWDPKRTSAVMGLRSPIHGGGGTAVLAASANDTETWTVVASSGGFLRVSGRWDRGWTATIDGRRSRVLRADGIFRGVVVPPGSHTVHFAYENAAEQRGVTIAAVAGLALVALLLPSRRHRAPSAGRA